MKRLACLLILLSMTATAVAQTPIKADLTTGNYALSLGTLSIDSAGTITVTQAPLSLVKLGVGPGPAPGPVPPVPTPLTPRAQAIQQAAASITGDPNRAQTAATLAGFYQQISVNVRNGKLTGQDTIAMAVKLGTDLILGAKIAPLWQPVRDVLTTQWTAVTNSGGNDAAYATLLDEAVAGLMATAPTFTLEKPDTDAGRQAIQGGKMAIDWATVLKIVAMILQMLLPLLSKVAPYVAWLV